VVDYDTRSNRHAIRYEDDGVQATLNLKNVSWNIYNERGAPGANPERQGARRALESSDDEDLLEVSGSSTIKWGTFACARLFNAARLCQCIQQSSHTTVQTSIA
jgi:hypothetical protein